jgi:hypothetical protein
MTKHVLRYVAFFLGVTQFILVQCFMSCSPQFCGNSDKLLNRYSDGDFANTEDNVILYKGLPYAKLQAITFSLDDNKLVREINVKLLDGVDITVVPNLIKFIHMRHHKAEVEVEMNMK